MNTYGSLSQRTSAWAATEALEHAEPILVLSKFGANKPVPKNKAQSVKFRRPKKLVVSTAPLVEGVAPSAQTFEYEDVEVKLEQYGNVLRLTDVVQDVAEDPVLADMSMMSGEQAAETVEMVTWGALRAGTTVFYDTKVHTSRAQVDSKVTKDRLRAIVRSLRSFRGKEHTSMMSSSVKYGTKAIESAFIAFCHSDLDGDIRDLPGFVSVADYGSQQPLCPEELGTVEKIRFITSPLLEAYKASGAAVGVTGMTSEGGANVDVYPIIVTAKNGYGVVPLKGKESISIIVVNPNEASASNPLGQVGSVGWKTLYAAAILNQTWVARYEVGATAI